MKSNRNIKIERAYRDQKNPSINGPVKIPGSVPKIRLEGAWLAKAGFPPEGRVHVEISQGTLVIRVEGSEVL